MSEKNKNVISINYDVGEILVETNESLEEAKKLFHELHKIFLSNIDVHTSYTKKEF